MEFGSVEKYGRNERQLIHDYIGVNYAIVWDVLVNKIPGLHIQIQEVLHNK